MSDLNEESLRHLSKLCRIEVSDAELPELFSNLKRVLDYVSLLQSVDVGQLDPYSHMDEQGITSLREDEVSDLLPREAFLNNAPDHVAGMIRVPPVMKQTP